MKKLLVFITGIFILTACSNKKQVNEVQRRGDIYYKFNSEKLFNGTIFSPFNKELNYFEKEIKDGKLHGTVKFWYRNGQPKYSFEFENNIPNGKVLAWYDNGVVKFSGEYSSNRLINNWLFNYENSDTMMVVNYNKNGEMNILREEYYPNGKLRLSVQFSDELMNGSFKYFSSNGVLLINGNYLDEKKNGIWEEYYQNGKLKLKGNFINNLRDNEWIYYDENGKIIFKINFKNDYPEGKGYALADVDTLNLNFKYSEKRGQHYLIIRGVDFLRGYNNYTLNKIFRKMEDELIVLINMIFFYAPYNNYIFKDYGMKIYAFDIKKLELWGSENTLKYKDGKLFKNIYMPGNDSVKYTYFGIKLCGGKINQYLPSLVYYSSQLSGVISKTGGIRPHYSSYIWHHFNIIIDSLYAADTSIQFSNHTKKDFKKLLKNSTGYRSLLDEMNFAYQNNMNELLSDLGTSFISNSIEEITSDNTQEKSHTDIDFSDCDKFLKAYEKFMLEYIDIIKKYKKNPDDFKLMSDYLNMLTEFHYWSSESESCKEDPEIASKIAKIQVKVIEAMEGL